MSSSKQRKSYLIKPDFQWKLISYSLLLSSLIIGTLYFANFVFFRSLRNLGIEVGLEQGHPFFQFLYEQSRFLDIIFGVLVLVVTTLTVVSGLWLSNKIAGPIYRVETSLEEMLEKGSTKPIAFRKGDFFVELMNITNRLIEKYRGTTTRE